MGFPSGTRSRAARARPGALTIRERARATRSGGSPRMRPLGKGWSRPRATHRGGTGHRCQKVVIDPELRAKLCRARVPGEEVVGAEIEPASPKVTGKDLASEADVGFEQDDLEVAYAGPDGLCAPAVPSGERPAGENTGRSKPANPTTYDNDPAHLERPSAHCTTRSAKAAQILGSAFNEAVRAKATPTSAATRSGLDIEVVEDLEVVRGETGGADDDGAHVLPGQGPQFLQDVGTEPGLRRAAGALPADLPTLEARGRCDQFSCSPQLARIRIAVGDDADRQAVGGHEEKKLAGGPCGRSGRTEGGKGPAHPFGEDLYQSRIVVPLLDKGGGHLELACLRLGAGDVLPDTAPRVMGREDQSDEAARRGGRRGP